LEIRQLEALAVLGRIDNLDVLCSDLARMVPFYRDVLGLTPLLGYEPGQGWAGFQAGDVSIFLIEVGGELPTRRTPGAGPAGIESFAFAVADLEAAIAELDGRGVEWAADVVESQWYRYRSLYDPEGNVLHITVPDRDALGLPR
jgi:catechol 2,3-dioxygenase-like lactoylglutathione lyase family enzyme